MRRPARTPNEASPRSLHHGYARETDVAIDIRGVNKRFGSTHAVRDLDLAVPVGTLCGFLGPNGAGKSTTIRMIMSIIYPDSGTIDVLGGNALQNKDRIGYLPEERGVYRKMRVGEFLRYIARLKGCEHAGLDDYIREWLVRVDLEDVLRKRCQELSKGMQQKVQFVAAVIHDPDLIILDEPFSGLDPVNVELLNRLIRELNGQGKTIIFSTHVLHQAELLCDRFFLIDHGVKLLDATLAEIREDHDPRSIIVEPLDHAAGGLAVDGVTDIINRDGGAGLELRLERDCDPQAIMRRIIEGVPVRSIELRQLSMEEVFISLVRSGKGEEAARKAREELTHV
jgi:ABC-2 type transport system ATP-binding protein